ncbi:uncharacterized protein MONOS_12498 [Monocercomonoides exilis]|uniref:uncharacterized protein n=1 Tax=Monocercomonoides exilis TaxID=2049356 RepID=UPI0035599653|nr:hypothetical protein MONOS_12498 [Monocercomonoides exilis]|eukprot:MONOS_12498.1-p1 / transcript=MONOS_12498.1 / gene=MONOS_12498 / organism=Monocercomonoides_exilis_PA203 / gene_product=unspecified product / transcript_product=unspecified product / location=Mono_scaffold00695:16824-17768(+) / protein_length=315 / sequence_SO=supercontig / SO=protein_coding / is_pseudo=false
MASMGASRISKKEGGQYKSFHSMPQHQLGEWHRSQFPFPKLHRGYREDQQLEQLRDRANGLRRSRERRERSTLLQDGDGQNAVEYRESDNAKVCPIQSTDSYKNGTRRSLREHRRCTEPVRLRKENKSRNLERLRDGNMEREHRRRLRIFQQDKTEERSEIREGGREKSIESFSDCLRVPNWEFSGTKLVESYCRYSRRRREYTDATWPQDARSEGEYSDWTVEGASSWETSEQAERVEEDWGRQTSEPWYKSSMEKSPIPNLIQGEKTQTRFSWDDGNDEQLFIPLGGGIEGRSGEAHTGVGGEVVQHNIHGD